jgi:hypothetical protein
VLERRKDVGHEWRDTGYTNFEEEKGKEVVRGQVKKMEMGQYVRKIFGKERLVR